MSSTNKTTHYDLSQYTASDKPTYLVDYNADMSAIDTGIYNAQTEATANTTAIGTLSNLTTTEKTNLVGAINEVDGNVDTLSGTVGQHTTAIADNTSDIGNLANLETTNKSNLVSAVNEVEGNIEKFNLKNVTQIQSNTITVTNGTLLSSNLYLAKNSDDSIFKFYGRIEISSTGSPVGVTIPVTLSVDTSYTIVAAGVKVLALSGQTITYVDPLDITVSNNQISISTGSASGARIVAFFSPVLYFNKSFGDQPTQ